MTTSIAVETVGTLLDDASPEVMPNVTVAPLVVIVASCPVEDGSTIVLELTTTSDGPATKSCPEDCETVLDSDPRLYVDDCRITTVTDGEVVIVTETSVLDSTGTEENIEPREVSLVSVDPECDSVLRLGSATCDALSLTWSDVEMVEFQSDVRG